MPIRILGATGYSARVEPAFIHSKEQHERLFQGAPASRYASPIIGGIAIAGASALVLAGCAAAAAKPAHPNPPKRSLYRVHPPTRLNTPEYASTSTGPGTPH